MSNSQNKILYKLKNIEHSYGNQFNLDIPELEIHEGHSLGLIGSNGSGKSTLMRILALLENPNMGEIIFKDRIVNRDTNARNRMTMLFQEPYLLKRSIFENIAFGLKMRGDKKNLKEKVSQSLKLVGLDSEKFLHRRWYELSGGETQRVALASRFILEPEVLILDEPVSNIDPVSSDLIKEAIKSIKEKNNTTLIISSHDTVWLNSITTEIIRMHNGKISGAGTKNIIPGPWSHGEDDLWVKSLSDKFNIYSSKPPEKNSTAILDPSDIIISEKKQTGISAQNMLKVKISSMSDEYMSDKIRIVVKLSELSLTTYITHHAAKELKLLPGRDVWIIFKASSIQWE